MLFKIIDLWNTTPLHLVPHLTEGRSILIISSTDDLIAQLEDSQAILASIKGSSYLRPIKVTAVGKALGVFSFSSVHQFNFSFCKLIFDSQLYESLICLQRR